MNPAAFLQGEAAGKRPGQGSCPSQSSPGGVAAVRAAQPESKQQEHNSRRYAGNTAEPTGQHRRAGERGKNKCNSPEQRDDVAQGQLHPSMAGMQPERSAQHRPSPVSSAQIAVTNASTPSASSNPQRS